VAILRVLLVLAASASAFGQFLQERHRLKVLQGLPGRRARDYYEATRTRDERLMVGVTVALVLGAAAALILTFIGRGSGGAAG
jgi:hypothetical protein